MSLPRTWAEIDGRLAELLGGPSVLPEIAEWKRQALEAAYGVEDVMALPRVKRSVALQKFSGVLLRLEEYPGDIAFDRDRRETIAAAFEEYLHVQLPGPPWRLGPAEEDRPLYDDWLASADFGAP